MNNPMFHNVDAYLDGELTVTQRKQFEQHLAGCTACAEKLEMRRRLSVLLHEMPAFLPGQSENEFIGAVRSRLEPRQPGFDFNVKSLAWSWLAVPVGLILALVFIQSVAWLSAVIGWIPGASSVLQDLPQVFVQEVALRIPGELFASGLPAPVGAVMAWSGFFTILNWNWLTTLVLLVGVGLLYASWLAGWWARTRQPAELVSHIDKEMSQ
jgi:anti-sigma factor RsiW